MKRLILAAAVMLSLASAAHAQSMASAAYISPLPFHGQAAFAASTSSAAINAAMTLAPNSQAFPLAAINGPLEIKVQSTSSTGIYICWQGGTCTSTVGEYIAPGESVTKLLHLQNMGNNPPTVISTGTPACIAEW